MLRIHRISFFLFFAGLVLSTPLFSQTKQASIQWGENYSEPAGTYLSKVISADGTGFYALRERTQSGLLGNSNKIFLEYYSSKNMRMLKSKAVDLRYKKKERDLEDIILLGGNLYLLTSFHNQTKQKNYLFAQEIGRKSLLPSKDLKKIGEIPTLNFRKDGSFDHHISQDSSKILIMNQLPYEKTEPERFALRVFDNSFNELWNRNISLPYNDQQFSIEEYRVDSDGNVYLLGILYTDGVRVRKRGKPNYQYIVLSYPADGGQSQEYKIRLKDEFITDLTFRISRKGTLVCSGFYSEQGASSIKGTYFFQLDPATREIYNQNLKAFDINFLVDDFSAAKQRRIQKAEKEGRLERGPELQQYSLDNLILRSDGGVVLVAEQFFVEEVTNNDFFNRNNLNNLRTDFYYNYNDIIVVNIRPTGEIEWASRIPKRQVTINDNGYYSSYAMSIVRDKIYFVFNDNARNYGNQKRNNRLYNFNGRQSIIALAELSKDGSVEIQPLFSNQEADIITRPKVCKQTDKREMVIYGERGRRYRFAHLEFLKSERS